MDEVRGAGLREFAAALVPLRHRHLSVAITVDPATLRPLSYTCQAGRHGQLCWAVIDVGAVERLATT